MPVAAIAKINGMGHPKPRSAKAPNAQDQLQAAL
jgi:hypothetical protein